MGMFDTNYMKTSTRDWSTKNSSSSSPSRTYVTYNRPSGDVVSGMEDLVSSYNEAYEQAKAHNEEMYREMLGISNQYLDTVAGGRYDTSSLYDEALGTISGMTDQRAADIRSDYERQTSSERQRLARLGMGNTTVGSTMAMGYEREKQSALNRLMDEIAGTKAGIYQNKASAQLAGEQARIGAMGGAYESLLNTMGKYGWEQTPDMSSLQSLLAGVASQYGQGQGLSTLLSSLGKIGV